MKKKILVSQVDEGLVKIREALHSNKLNDAYIKDVRDEIVGDEEEVERQKKPRKKFIGVMRPEIDEGIGTGWIVSVDQGFVDHTILDKLEEIRNAFNITKKGAKNPATNIGELFMYVPNAFFKQYGLEKKTKESIYLFSK